MSGVKKVVIILCVSLIFIGSLFAFSSCGEQAEQDQITYLIGVSQANLIDPWQIALKQDIELKANEYPNVKVIYSDAGGSNEKQQTDIEDMLVQKVDLIIVFPNEIDYISNVLKNVQDQGKHVILLGYPTEGKEYSARIFTDNYKVGKMAGEYAAKLMDEQGIILEIQGDPTDRISVDRKIGFVDAIQAHESIIKEYVVVGYWSRDNAIEVLNSSGLLDRVPRVNLVFAHNDEMAIGASKLIESMSKDIHIIGVDGILGNNRGIEAVNAGRLSATVTYPTGGKEAMDYAVKLLGGEQIPKEIELQVQLITQENAD